MIIYNHDMFSYASWSCMQSLFPHLGSCFHQSSPCTNKSRYWSWDYLHSHKSKNNLEINAESKSAWANILTMLNACICYIIWNAHSCLLRVAVYYSWMNDSLAQWGPCQLPEQLQTKSASGREVHVPAFLHRLRYMAQGSSATTCGTWTYQSNYFHTVTMWVAKHSKHSVASTSLRCM